MKHLLLLPIVLYGACAIAQTADTTCYPVGTYVNCTTRQNQTPDYGFLTKPIAPDVVGAIAQGREAARREESERLRAERERLEIQLLQRQIADQNRAQDHTLDVMQRCVNSGGVVLRCYAANYADDPLFAAGFDMLVQQDPSPEVISLKRSVHAAIFEMRLEAEAMRQRAASERPQDE